MCDSTHVFQYYNLNLSLVPGSGFYDGRKTQKEYFLNFFKKVKDSTTEKYFVTIRFIVNCKGQTDRFRSTVIDAHYKPFKKYNKNVVKQLIQIASRSGIWKPAKFNGSPCDYYYYITFTVLNGEIINLAP